MDQQKNQSEQTQDPKREPASTPGAYKGFEKGTGQNKDFEKGTWQQGDRELEEQEQLPERGSDQSER